MRNIKIIGLILLLTSTLLGAQSCRNKSKNKTIKPANLINKEVLSDILFDVYIIESAIYYKTQKGVDIGLYTTAYYTALFKKHNITKKQFSQSMSYYLETDKNGATLFSNVINRLMSIQTGPSKSTNNSQSKPEIQPQNQPQSRKIF